MSNAHRFQRSSCKHAVEQGLVPILNAASKEDPAHLARDFNAVNLDILTFDPHTHRQLSELKNFVQGDLRVASTIFDAGYFGTIILGEFLEHCVFDAAKTVFIELRKILRDDGQLVITFPLDDRPPERQHGKELLKAIVKGETGHDIVSWHQTMWDDALLEKLFAETGWREVSREPLHYGFVPNHVGWGLTLEKG